MQRFSKLGSQLSRPLTQQRFLERAGLPAPADEAYPDEPITAYKNTLKKTVVVHHKDFKTRQFLEKDGKVLRFFCVWDDRGSVYGERRPYVSGLLSACNEVPWKTQMLERGPPLRLFSLGSEVFERCIFRARAETSANTGR